jgi:hypothetical protein
MKAEKVLYILLTAVGIINTNKLVLKSELFLEGAVWCGFKM